MSLFGWITEETPKYHLLQSLNASVELRRYDPQVRIRSRFSQDNPGFGFRPLARYIFGGNSESKYISMTAPVLQEDTKDGNQTMDFVLPSAINFDQLPKPNDPNVEILKIPQQDFMVITFNGNPRSGELVQSKLLELRAIAYENSLDIDKSKYILAIYNPPWTFHYFRKNEILVPIKMSE